MNKKKRLLFEVLLLSANTYFWFNSGKFISAFAMGCGFCSVAQELVGLYDERF